MTEITTRPTISRRKIAQSMAWTVPVIALAGAAPAMAASRLSGCATLKWTDTTLSGTQGTSGIRTGSITLPEGSLVTVRVTQHRIGGQPGRDINSGKAAPTSIYGDFSATAAGAQQAWANGVTSNQSSLYVVAAGSSSSVLTLNQGTSTSANGTTRGQETLTFSFESSTGKVLTPTSITFNAYDVTSQLTNMNNAAYYTDSLSFSGATATYGTAVGAPSIYEALPGSLSSLGTKTSTSAGNYIPVTLTPTSATPIITYINASTTPLVPSSNYQYVGIGDLKVCF
ncbi:hypothetical protein HD598_000174 [Neomicrococcus aestuarii]|uniref:Lipoprotein n=1 Tax=Neomicrococcus aestuarii TaxID=556325 RepID=A0A7W8TRB8_9MICC|nr:hypothetical protein [Neomicrococcus aestuarii]MBB5511487.1 hypothetical protein [Neomicrococcus aestuarii]